MTAHMNFLPLCMFIYWLRVEKMVSLKMAEILSSLALENAWKKTVLTNSVILQVPQVSPKVSIVSYPLLIRQAFLLSPNGICIR